MSGNFSLAKEIKRLSQLYEEGIISKDEFDKIKSKLVNDFVDEPSSENIKVREEISAAETQDEYFTEAGLMIIRDGKGSVSLLQRRLKIGYNRASRIMDQLEQANVIQFLGSTRTYEAIMSENEFQNLQK